MSMVSQQNQAGISLGEIDRVVAGTHHDPHSILGAHPGPDGVVVRVLRPLAKSVTVVLPDGQRFPAEHLHEGVFAATLPAGQTPDYRVAVSYPDGNGGSLPEITADDPYRFLPSLGEVDLHLIAEGRHENLWEVLGAHVKQYGAVTGTAFAVWAPNARGVRVIADFNHWDGRGHPMRSLGGTGRLGAVRARRGRRDSLQVRRRRAGRAVAAQGRPHGQPGRAAARDRVGHLHVPVRVGRRRMAGWPRAGEASRSASRSACTRCTWGRGGPACPTSSSPTS